MRIGIVLLIVARCFTLMAQENPTGNHFPELTKWISNCSHPLTDELQMYANQPAPMFRKSFDAGPGKVRKAILYITAAGYFEASINGKRLGDSYLDPAWTDFSKRIYYSEFDLTTQLNKGANCLGVTLGNGFYNPLPLRMWGHLNLRNALPTGTPAFIACLKVDYADGKSMEIKTDETWTFAPGPILRNSVYLGEWYDARNEIPGWNLSGFDGHNWAKACEVGGPGGKLQSRFFQPVKITSPINPVKITETEKGIFVVDMGTNFAGIYKIRMKGKTGDTITFRFGERLYENKSLNPMTTACGQIKRKGQGGPGSPDIAWQTDTYVFGKNTNVWYEPRFTFHTFRYMEIKGLKQKPELSDISGMALNTAVEECNQFECSSALLNAIQKMCVRTFKSNLVSVQSDCPARERFGYGGDINAVADAYISNFNMHQFYRKAVYDWVDVLNDSVFMDTAPYIGLKYCGISWESAFLFLQDKLYQNYDDGEIVREMYQLDLKWMEKVARLHPGLIIDKGLGDHESMVKVPVQVTGTCHYLLAARVMKNFAALMHDTSNEKKFAELEMRIGQKLLDTFWRHPANTLEPMNKQTLYAALLYSGAIPENEKSAAVDSLKASVAKAANGHFTTGIFGTQFILEAMSQAGLTQQVFDIVNSTAFPGWGHMIDRGATTIWETWKESDNTFSNCHPMFGSVSGWFYRWLGGIQPVSAGFEKVRIAPFVPGNGLNYVKAAYKTPYGYIRSEWEKSTSGEIKYKITVPEGTTAEFKALAPVKEKAEIMNGPKKISLNAHDFNNGQLCKVLNAGTYMVTIKK